MPNEVNIRGDAARQAISSLKGYAYQLYESALAWVSLAEDEFLFLEVAEDYAIATTDALHAVQVKATSTAITLNSKEVIDTINSFFELSKGNPGKAISIKHLTTASIGLEKKIADRIDGKSGLEYWLATQAGSDVEPLRRRLLEIKLSKDATQFLKTSSQQQLKDGLIKRIEWLSGAKNLESLRRALSNRLVYLGEKRKVASSLCDAMVDPLVSRILSLASSEGFRRLERADFIRFFDEASRVNLPVSVVETMMSAISPVLGSSSHGFVSSVAVLRPVAPIDPNKFAARTELGEIVQRSVDEQNFAWLYGATGTGKSSLSRLIADEAGVEWYSLQLRSLDARETAEALYRASSQIAIEKPGGVVLDDLGPLTSSLPKGAFFNLIETARRTSTRILVTANLEPPSAVLAALGTTTDAVIKIGNLTEEQVAAFVSAKGGNSHRWARYVHVATGSGHPLLVDAMVRGLQAQGWSVQEMRELSAILGNNRDIEEVKSEICQRLFQELNEDESNLLVRLSLVLGTFDRKMAMFLGELVPAIDIPGRAFDNLIGAWIEAESEDRFRLSSLVSNVGGRTLGLKATKCFHHALADYYTEGWKLDADRFDDMILHGMVGKNENALTAVCLAVLSAKPEDLQLIAKYTTNIAAFRTDQSLYPDNQSVSMFLRMAQVLLLVSSKRSRQFREALEAFERESADRGEAANGVTFSMVYAKALSLPGLVEVVDDLSQFALTALEHARKLDISITETDFQTAGPVTTLDGYLQFMFAFQLSRISNVDTLQRAMKSLIAKTKRQRDFLLKAFEGDHFEKSLVIKSSWIKLVDESAIANERLAGNYASLARDLAEAGEPEFAMAAFESAAVIWDEYLKNPERAVACLEEATGLLGETQAATRALSRVYFHQRDYERQLQVGIPLSESFEGGSTEASFFFRELAMGNSHLGKHRAAKALYLEAYNRIATDPSKGTTPMSAGMLADAAVEAHWDGDSVEAVKLFSRALDAAETLDPDDGLYSAAVIRLIAHSVVWLMLQIKGKPKAVGEHVMIIGANSNPAPHEGLEGRMALPLDHVWYVLAEAEAALDVDCAVINRLLSKDWDARAVLTSEISLYVSIASSAERRLSPQDYLSRTPRGIDARVFVERNAADLMKREASSSPRERLQQLKAEEFAEQHGYLAQNVLMFTLRLAFLKSPTTAVNFMAEAHALQRPLITRAMLDAFMEGAPSAAGDEIALAGTIGCVVKTIAEYQQLAVVDLMLVCLRLLELMEKQFCEPSTVAKVRNWVLGHWKEAAISQAFQLSSPQLAQISLAEYEKRAGDQLSDIADLILTLKPFVKINLGQTYQDWLSEIKNRDKAAQST